MPYINTEDRKLLDPAIKEIVTILRTKPGWNVAGLVNYVITKIIISLWASCRSYHMGNSIIGVLECASREFSRRYLNWYEDGKIEENGDVHPL